MKPTLAVVVIAMFALMAFGQRTPTLYKTSHISDSVVGISCHEGKLTIITQMASTLIVACKVDDVKSIAQ